MIDIANYKRAIQWLRRGMDEQACHPADAMLRDGLIHSFEVNYNISEVTLRQALIEITGEPSLGLLSSRDLMRYAKDEGLFLSSSVMWLQYALAIEQADARVGETFPETIEPLLTQFADPLEDFAQRLEDRLALVA